MKISMVFTFIALMIKGGGGNSLSTVEEIGSFKVGNDWVYEFKNNWGGGSYLTHLFSGNQFVLKIVFLLRMVFEREMLRMSIS